MTPVAALWFDKHSRRWRIYTRDGSTTYYYRAVIENEIGRPLTSTEHVHHRNGDTTDDRLENLELIDARAHGALHWPEAAASRRANWRFDWSRDHAACVECGTTDSPHYCVGHCRRCYQRTYMRQRRAAA